MGVPLTLVIPLRLTVRPDETLRRLRGILASVPANIGVVVADDTADARARRQTARLIARRPGARHIEVLENTAEPFSVGRLRDQGAEAAPEGLVLFHDVDFAAPAAFYRRLAGHIEAEFAQADLHAFRCVPVWFLKRRGTMWWRLAPPIAWRILRRGGAGARALATRLTRGSSAVVLRRAALLDIGGHSPLFTGHGAEDFELMHRLSTLSPMGPRPLRYSRDFGSGDQGDDGFRAYFGRYGEPFLNRGIVLAHLWHSPRTEDGRYYANRRTNFMMLEKTMVEAEPSCSQGFSPAVS